MPDRRRDADRCRQLAVSGTTIYHGCHIGQRAIVHSGAVIGADGFGFAREATGEWVKIAQTGRVVIGDDVEIGANTTIDRGALEDTVIEDGVKLDNQIQIGHNVRIGAHTRNGRLCRHRRQRKNRRSLHDRRRRGHPRPSDAGGWRECFAGTLVGKSIATAGNYTGTVPFMAHEDWQKNFARLRHLDAMADKIRTLEKRLAQLEQLLEKKT